MHVKSVEEVTHKWLRKCTMAYLEGQHDLKWIVGIYARNRSQAREMLTKLRDYGDPQRFRELVEWCETAQGS